MILNADLKIKYFFKKSSYWDSIGIKLLRKFKSIINKINCVHQQERPVLKFVKIFLFLLFRNRYIVIIIIYLDQI